METKAAPERHRQMRGTPYSLAEFQAKYGLANKEAEDLFVRFGPSSIELDLLMAAKQRPLSFSAVVSGLLPSNG